MSKSAEEVIGELDWTPVEEQLNESGSSTIKIVSTTNGFVVECLLPNLAEQSPFRLLSGAHCATCQCNKINPTAPVPENPRSKSWHENAAGEKPKS